MIKKISSVYSVTPQRFGDLSVTASTTVLTDQYPSLIPHDRANAMLPTTTTVSRDRTENGIKGTSSEGIFLLSGGKRTLDR